MEDESKTPMMLTFMFGEAAEVARRGASERLLRWCRAYDEWLAERRRTYRPNTVKQSVLAWRRLIQQCGKTPWELTAADIEQHAAWMQAEGYSPATTGCALGIFSNFYRWCSQRQVDPECEEGFNPAEEVRRPKGRRYHGAKLLSREEVEALLRTMQRDPSELGKRDYAFTLARLRLGAPLGALQQLKWGQIEHDDSGAWVRWRAGTERYRLPEEAWEAMRAWLEASGRLAGMRDADYVFAPLVDPIKADVGGKPEDWERGRCLSTSQILSALKLYGRLAGIEEGKLTLMALRRTATRLRLDEGASVEEMQAFLDSREEVKSAKYRLGRLPELPADAGGMEGEEDEGRLPVRRPKPFKPGEGMTHGFYARSLPSEAVMAVVEENIQGMEEEIVGLRILERELLVRAEKASDHEAEKLWEAYTLASLRLGEVVKWERELREGSKTSRKAEEWLQAWDQVSIMNGWEPLSEKVRAEALGGTPGLEAGARRLVEEIAGMRYCLRRAFRAAMEATENRDTIRNCEIYSSGCVRLVKLLRIDVAGGDRLDQLIKDTIDQAISEVTEEMGLYI